MDQKLSEISEKLFRRKYEQLNEREKKVADRLAERTPISIQQEQLRLIKQLSEDPRKDQ